MEYKYQAYNAAKEIIEIAGLKSGQILIVGCSTSEISGEKIGTDSSPEIAREVFDGIYTAANEKGVFVAAQCCEHLNRAVICERAGGSCNALKIMTLQIIVYPVINHGDTRVKVRSGRVPRFAHRLITRYKAKNTLNRKGHYKPQPHNAPKQHGYALRCFFKDQTENQHRKQYPRGGYAHIKNGYK